MFCIKKLIKITSDVVFWFSRTAGFQTSLVPSFDLGPQNIFKNEKQNRIGSSCFSKWQLAISPQDYHQ